MSSKDYSPSDNFPKSLESQDDQSLFDIVFVGAGLANCLLALRITEINPALRICILDANSELGLPRRTWSYHLSDFELNQHAATSAWLKQFSPHQWRGYEVRFPNLKKQFEGQYFSIDSQKFFDKVEERLASNLKLGQRVVRCHQKSVELDSGVVLEASLVVDGRGDQTKQQGDCGYQKFVGHFVRLEEPHGLERPILMDADLSQLDGFRFLYTLPLSDDELLIEDTRYSDSPSIHEASFREGIEDYARSQGWKISSVTRKECGSLPIPLHSAHKQFQTQSADDLRSGLRSGLFHATTGYSILFAAKFAFWFAEQDFRDIKKLQEKAFLYQEKHWRRNEFYRRLNSMLFLAAEQSQRFKIFERFYRLPPQVIQRFYALKLDLVDQLRLLLSGRPPVAMLPGAKAFFKAVEPRKDRLVGSLTQDYNPEFLGEKLDAR